MAGGTTKSETSGEAAPLDPAAERLRSKLVRFMIINLVIVFGLLAVVVGFLVFRSDTDEPAIAEEGRAFARGEYPASDGTLHLGPDERIGSLTADGHRVTLHLKGVDGERILQLDMRDGRVLGEIAVDRVP